MTKRYFFNKIEKQIMLNNNAALCKNIDCDKCCFYPSCPINKNGEIFLNAFIKKEYEKYKAEILTEKLK